MTSTAPKLSDEKKHALWRAYGERRAPRVPLRWNTNSRVVLLDPVWNPEGWDYETFFHDPRVHLTVLARWQAYQAEVLGPVSDMPAAPPEAWTAHVELQNVYDAAYFGAGILYRPGQVPDTRPLLDAAGVEDFIAGEPDRPLENPYIRDRLQFREALEREAKSFAWRGRKVAGVAPLLLGFDGPLTVAVNLMGQDILTLLVTDPDKAVRLMNWITRACIARNHALARHAGTPPRADFGGLADDCIQLIGTEMYAAHILPLHELWYRETSTTMPADRARGIHLCGDATRHFRTIADQLGVVSFDTGFPVDHGALRRELGPEIEISGGPHIALLRDGTPEACAERAREILLSGVKEGGRFILQEGNNLPPCVPVENLRAVYETCLEYGGLRPAA